MSRPSPATALACFCASSPYQPPTPPVGRSVATDRRCSSRDSHAKGDSAPTALVPLRNRLLSSSHAAADPRATATARRIAATRAGRPSASIQPPSRIPSQTLALSLLYKVERLPPDPHPFLRAATEPFEENPKAISSPVPSCLRLFPKSLRLFVRRKEEGTKRNAGRGDGRGQDPTSPPSSCEDMDDHAVAATESFVRDDQDDGTRRGPAPPRAAARRRGAPRRRAPGAAARRPQGRGGSRRRRRPRAGRRRRRRRTADEASPEDARVRRWTPSARPSHHQRQSNRKPSPRTSPTTRSTIRRAANPELGRRHLRHLHRPHARTASTGLPSPHQAGTASPNQIKSPRPSYDRKYPKPLKSFYNLDIVGKDFN